MVKQLMEVNKLHLWGGGLVIVWKKKKEDKFPLTCIGVPPVVSCLIFPHMWVWPNPYEADALVTHGQSHPWYQRHHAEIINNWFKLHINVVILQWLKLKPK